jgi:8-oxo-dGTP pyrophosphatase MutT (NUDIX family)
MTLWRPSSAIRVKALGLHWRDGCLLASEVNRDDGTLKGVRPQGGTVEFGETWQDALIREFQEEIGVGIELIGDPIVLENIYTHHGALGHEILFISEIIFSPNAYETVEFVEHFEDNGEPCVARWFDPVTLLEQGIALYPKGLLSQITAWK